MIQHKMRQQIDGRQKDWQAEDRQGFWQVIVWRSGVIKMDSDLCRQPIVEHQAQNHWQQANQRCDDQCTICFLFHGSLLRIAKAKA